MVYFNLYILYINPVYSLQGNNLRLWNLANKRTIKILLFKLRMSVLHKCDGTVPKAVRDWNDEIELKRPEATGLHGHRETFI